MLTEAAPHEVLSPRGRTGTLYARDYTSDMALAFGTFSDRWTRGSDEYDLAKTEISGVFVDVGAHIGIITLAVLLDNPDATAILVEPIPENLSLARRTMAANGFDATFVEAAVGTSTIRYGGESVDDRYVGNIGSHDGHTIEVPTITLGDLVGLAGGSIDALKVDCEGGEWSLLDSPDVAACRLIFGEWHGTGAKFNGKRRLRAMLGETHHIRKLTDNGGIGLFWAVRR